jgi:hypothetical protein
MVINICHTLKKKTNGHGIGLAHKHSQLEKEQQ